MDINIKEDLKSELILNHVYLALNINEVLKQND